MKIVEVIIKIPQKVYEDCIMIPSVIKDWKDEISKAFKNGIVLPEDATNGDMIKALFPNGSQVKGASIYVMNDNKSNVFYDFDWWNAPYKAGDTDKNK